MCRVRLPHNEKLLLASESETFNSLNKSREEKKYGKVGGKENKGRPRKILPG